MANEALAAVKDVSPRLRLACQLYVTGAAKTKKEASELAGLHPSYLTMMTNANEPTRRVVSELQQRILNESIDASVVLRTLGRRALAKLDELIDSPDEKVALGAAKDLADRSPETQKTIHLNSQTLSLGMDDAKELAKALVESSRERGKYLDAKDGINEVTNVEVARSPALALVKGESSV